MGIWLQHPLADPKILWLVLSCCLGPWDWGWVIEAFYKLPAEFPFLVFSNLVHSVQQQNKSIFVHLRCLVEQLKVTADFSLYSYRMLQMPLRCFSLRYLKMLCYIDFWGWFFFSSKGLKISALTLKPSEIIDYLFLPPPQLFTSCPSMEKGCAISRWLSAKQIFAELKYQFI